MNGDDEFNVRLGRIGNRGRGESFVNEVLRAARKAGHEAGYAAGRRSPRLGHSGFGRGRTAFGRSRLFATQRRAILKSRVARHRNRAFRSAPLAAHIAYLERDGVTREGEKAHMFGATEDRTDTVAFARRSHDDRHHFRFVVAPEDAAEMTDLRAFTRDLAAQVERDLGTRLDWVAVDHWNTDNPHVHLLVRGVAEDGSDLVISRDYMSQGLRSRAEELVSDELGSKPEHEIRSALAREVDAERWTRLDVAIRMAADDTGFIDLRPENPGAADPEVRRLAIGRLQRLERMGLAAAVGPSRWIVGLDAERALRELGMRGDIIKTMHRAFTERGQDRGIANYVIDSGAASSPIIGRLVDTGLHDELTGEAYAVIDGADGRAHHVRFRGVEAFAHAPPAGGIVEVRRFGSPGDPRPTLVLANRSDIDLDRQVTARGATWLDYRLVEREQMPLAMGGFGREVRDALAAPGRASRHGRTRPSRGAAHHPAARPSRHAAKPRSRRRCSQAVGGDRTALHAGGWRRDGRRHLSSAHHADLRPLRRIDNGLGFALVPWTPALDRHLGRHVSGVAKGGGGIEWSFGRKRGLEI